MWPEEYVLKELSCESLTWRHIWQNGACRTSEQLQASCGHGNCPVYLRKMPDSTRHSRLETCCSFSVLKLWAVPIELFSFVLRLQGSFVRAWFYLRWSNQTFYHYVFGTKVHTLLNVSGMDCEKCFRCLATNFEEQGTRGTFIAYWLFSLLKPCPLPTSVKNNRINIFSLFSFALDTLSCLKHDVSCFVLHLSSVEWLSFYFLLLCGLFWLRTDVRGGFLWTR